MRTTVIGLILFGVVIAVGAGTAGAGAARAQGSRKDDVVFNAQGRPMAGATIRVCASTATGQPCSPLASIYSDSALTQALANPISADGLGNYTFYAAPGRYEIEISGPGITTKQMPNVILPSDPSTPTFATVTTTSGISAFSLSLTGDLTVGGAVISNTYFRATETTAPTGAANSDFLWADSTDHRWKMNNNNGLATDVAGVSDVITPYNIDNVLYLDGTTYNPSPDLGATINTMVSALPAGGGTIVDTYSGATTISTTISDGGKIVHFVFGAVGVTCNVQCIHLTNQGSSIEGSGDASRFTAASGLGSTIPLIYVDGTAGGSAPYDHTVKGLYLIQGRNSNVGLLKVNLGVKTNISDIVTDGTTANGYKMIGIELWNGFAESVRNVRCVNSASSICIGITAPAGNVSNESVQDIDVFNMTSIALNYAANSSAPTFLDSTQLLNVQATGSTGQTAKQGLTTSSGSQSAGITSFAVAAGSACTTGYQAWIGVDGDEEWNIVTNVVSNTLTLMFPTWRAHANGERVLCGNVGVELASNTDGVLISPIHIESYGTGIDCQDCKEVTIDRPNIGNSTAEGGIVGDGIRLDSVLQTTIISPFINGFTNAINVTSRTPTWGSAFGVNVVGYTVQGLSPGNTHEGIANNSGADPTAYAVGCSNTYPSFNPAINCPSAMGPILSLPLREGAAPGSTYSNYDLCYGDSTAHAVKCSFNNGSFGQVCVGGYGCSPASMTAAGISDGQTAVTVTTGTSATLGGTYSKTIVFNQEATAATAVTYTLPAAAAGKEYCPINSNNGSAPDTGTITIQTSGTGQFIIFSDATLSASGGYVISGGAAADAACVIGVDSTHWQLFVQAGTWTKH